MRRDVFWALSRPTCLRLLERDPAPLDRCRRRGDDQNPVTCPTENPGFRRVENHGRSRNHAAGGGERARRWSAWSRSTTSGARSWSDDGTPLRDIAARAARIRILLADVDGVLTDGGLYYFDGGLAVRFDVRDGLGLALARQMGIVVGIISGPVFPQSAAAPSTISMKSHLRCPKKAPVSRKSCNAAGWLPPIWLTSGTI